MKKYTFNYNGCTGKGTGTIEANTKKEAIKLAQEKIFGVCVSSFRIKKK